MKITLAAPVAALLLSAAALAAPAWAGYKEPAYAVAVGSTFAYGTVGGARNSPDNTQYLGCDISVAAGSSWGYCYAGNLAQRGLYCWTMDARKLDLIASLGSDSYLEFDANADGECTYVDVGNASWFERKL